MCRSVLVIIIACISSLISAQTVTIPAYTGYAVPAETDESSLFSEKNGLQQWCSLSGVGKSAA